MAMSSLFGTVGITMYLFTCMPFSKQDSSPREDHLVEMLLVINRGWATLGFPNSELMISPSNLFHIIFNLNSIKLHLRNHDSV